MSAGLKLQTSSLIHTWWSWSGSYEKPKADSSLWSTPSSFIIHMYLFHTVTYIKTSSLCCCMLSGSITGTSSSLCRQSAPQQYVCSHPLHTHTHTYTHSTSCPSPLGYHRPTYLHSRCFHVRVPEWCLFTPLTVLPRVNRSETYGDMPPYGPVFAVCQSEAAVNYSHCFLDEWLHVWDITARLNPGHCLQMCF